MGHHYQHLLQKSSQLVWLTSMPIVRHYACQQLSNANFPTHLPTMIVDINSKTLADSFTRPLVIQKMPTIQQSHPLAFMATLHPSLHVMAKPDATSTHLIAWDINGLLSSYKPSELLDKFYPPLASMKRDYKLPFSPHAITDCIDQSLAIEMCTLLHIHLWQCYCYCCSINLEYLICSPWTYTSSSSSF